MEIRRTTLNDLTRVMEIYDIARQFMKSTGNDTQWNDSYPSENLITSDINDGVSYVILDGEQIVGTFVFVEGEEPTYSAIDGCWLNEKPYGTIHRIASDGSTKGIADICLSFCIMMNPNIRIDTHKNNSVMLSWIGRSGFKKCGIIRVSDGTPRYAFQLDEKN